MLQPIINDDSSGLRIPSDQRQLPASLPSHLADVLTFGDGGQSIGDNPGMC